MRLTSDSGFVAYTSTTGRIYPGGKVERELEEVQETAEEYLALAKKYFTGKAEAGPFVAAKRETDKKAARD